MKNRLLILATACALPSVSLAATFSEDFNDGNAASRWSVASQIEATAASTTVPDGSVDFAFDYSTLGIANPNGGADTIGAFIQVNSTDQAGDEGESYIIFPTGLDFSGDFVLTADMFVYNDGLSGSTELGIAGLFLNNADPVAPYQWGARGGPLAWAYTGEGGSTADLAVFKEGNATTTGYAGIADYGALGVGDIPGFETGVPGALGPAPATTPRGSWVKVRIESVGSVISWYLNGALIDSYDNSGGFYTSGNIFLGATDPFNSANAGGGVIVDNVVVPEPATLVLAASGLCMLTLRKKRSA